ncbi:MAG: alcohol dehydrogenase catalytic domain-containing protein [Chloroflexota bacterium]|nr:alcohol dehydrogenase catalytic domain-containing protein [Chloroflexota bacterium]MDE2894844.1 alcohol dehydrogenase catalytic domain-containing protein [Chloroflexota bacterium]
MRRAAWNTDATLSLIEAPDLTPGEGEVVVRVLSEGICGTDLHSFRGHMPPEAGRTPGHEMGGIVSTVGPGVDHVREGDVVGVEPLLRCGACRLCVAGHYNQCQVAGGLIGLHVDGGMAQEVLAPAPAIFKSPSGVDAELTALAEPLACAVHGFNQIAVNPDETVLIIGAGTIGLTAQLAAQAAGAATIVLARHPHQRDAARRLGAAEVLGEDDASQQRLAELAAQDSIDLVAECVGGHADTIRQSIDVVRRLGRVLVLGLFAIESVPINPVNLMLHEVTVVGSVTYGAPGGRPADYQQALNILASYQAEARSLITHRFTLGEVNTAFETAQDKGSQSIKVHLTPNA